MPDEPGESDALGTVALLVMMLRQRGVSGEEMSAALSEQLYRASSNASVMVERVVSTLRAKCVSEDVADVLAQALYDTCGGDAGRAAGKLLVLAARQRAKPPAAKA